jgi:hypothetical protein
MSPVGRVFRNPESPWLATSGLVLGLALADRWFISNQAVAVDQVLDAVTIIGAMLGACLSWWSSYRLPLRARASPGVFLKVRIFWSWMFGPMIVVAVACLARDIDGGLLLFYVPFFGVLLSILVLPWLFLARSRRPSNPSGKAALDAS